MPFIDPQKSNVGALGAGLATPPKPPAAGLHTLGETFGAAEWLGQETGHSAVGCGLRTLVF